MPWYSMLKDFKRACRKDSSLLYNPFIFVLWLIWIAFKIDLLLIKYMVKFTIWLFKKVLKNS